MSRRALLDHYKLIDRFAVGGVAEIFRAHDLRNGNLVIVKRIKQDMEFEPKVVTGFVRECELALSLAHPNLIHGLERGTHKGQDFVVLEFVDGQDLGHVLSRAQERHVRIPLEFALHLAREVLDGLHFAHNLKNEWGALLGLVHRDLSPRNVFVSYDGSIRVADWGASLFTMTEPEPQEVVGSPGYMAPEQAALEALDRRADIFSVGCIFLEMVLGHAAFDVRGLADEDVLRLHRAGVQQQVPETVPESVRDVLWRATALRPDDRYSTAKEMQTAIDRVMQEGNMFITPLAIASMTRHLFRQEFKDSRLPGSPLTF